MKKLHLLFQAFINNYSVILSQQKLNHRGTLRTSLYTLQNSAISFGTYFNIINYSDFMSRVQVVVKGLMQICPLYDSKMFVGLILKWLFGIFECACITWRLNVTATATGDNVVK